MFGWSDKRHVKVYRDARVVSLVPKDEGWVGVQIRLDLPHEIGDLVSEDGLLSTNMRGDRVDSLQVGDRVQLMEIRVENMRLVYFHLELLP